ncbi:MAG: bifunctional photosynthetic reaction center subunit L/M, partial [Dehalococcoidia bacterium]|nr:bifunctional photosynthetic reaction center subunit L/M [Dehalococcoidia bacterium]
MGAWGNGFNLGITAHLDWVSNIGYQYFNFFYNPFHALAIAGLFGTTMLLSMHGGAIRSEMGRPWVTEANIDAFWRGSLGYSIGEIGIHRLGFWAAAISILLANVCIFLSGTLVQDWNAFWSFWDKLPFWSYGALLIGVIAWLPKARKLVDPREAVDLDEVESYKANNLLDSYVGGTVYVPIVDRLFGNGLFGKVYVGVWGVAAGICFLIAVAIILGEYLRQVNYNGLLFVREFAVLSVNPPPANVGLGFAPWQQGGAWQAATFFLTASIGAFWARQFFRARQVGIGRDVAFAFLSAIFLYLVIYIIRPVIMGAWTEAPPHGLQSHLNWVNNLNVRYGNFYYNPFHMISIFFLLGSVMLFGMHGATIVATSRYGSEHEAKEMMAEGPGTHRAQLFWRWVMGWNANSESIHHWCWWFGILCVVAGAIGLLLTGTVVYDWYAWAVNAQIAHRPF